MTDLMTPTEVRARYDTLPLCMYCHKPAPFGNAPHAVCQRCLWCCHRCGEMLPLDSDTHYCEECAEHLAFDAWDQTQP